MKIELLLGVYGSLTGTIAIAISYANRVSSIKNRIADLRIRFQTMLNNAKKICDDFEKLSSRAERSRAARLAASGSLGGGGHQKWKNELSEDRQAISGIAKKIDELKNKSQAKMKIEDLIVQMDQIEKTAISIKEKYDKSITEDKQNVVQKK